MNTQIQRLLISTITSDSRLTITACHDKTATLSASAAATVAQAASAGTGSGSHQAYGPKKGAMADACGA